MQKGSPMAAATLLKEIVELCKVQRPKMARIAKSFYVVDRMQVRVGFLQTGWN